MNVVRLSCAIVLWGVLPAFAPGSLEAGSPGKAQAKGSATEAVQEPAKRASVALRGVPTAELNRRVELGDASAAIALADRLLAQEGEPYDPQRAIALLYMAAKGGDSEAKFQLAKSFLELKRNKVGDPLTEAQQAMLTQDLEALSSAGWADARFELGRFRLEAADRVKDFPALVAGWKLILDADRRGSASAATFLGEFTASRPLSFFPQEYRHHFFPETAIEDLLKRGLERGDLNAYLALGSYFGGLGSDGKTRDRSKAIAWLEQGTRNGKPIAAVRLAELYMEGSDAEKDPIRAKAWLKWASERGVFAGPQGLARQSHLDQRIEALVRARGRQASCEARLGELKREKRRLDQADQDLEMVRFRFEAKKLRLGHLKRLAQLNKDPGSIRTYNEALRDAENDRVALNRAAQDHQRSKRAYNRASDEYNADCARSDRP